MPEMSEETRNLIIQFQNYQQQLQNILIQKETLQLQSSEIEKALEELEKTKQTTAYKITGQIMINKPVVELKEELREVKEATDIKIKSLEKATERINNKLSEVQTKLKEVIK